MYLNRINLIGRLVADPMFKKGDAQDGSNDRVWGRIAVGRPNSEETDFFPFVCWGATARAVSDYCKKGKVLILDGVARTRSTQRDDGTWDNYFEVNCSAVYFGPDAKNTKSEPPQATQPVASTAASPTTPQAITPDAAQALLAQLIAGMTPQTPATTPAAAPATNTMQPFMGGSIPL